MNDNTCADCKHFFQHYIMRKKIYSAVDCGHCATPRLKTRKPETSACAHFEPIKIHVPMSYIKNNPPPRAGGAQ